MTSTDGTDPRGSDFSDPKQAGGVTDEDSTFGDRDDQEPIAVSENTGQEAPSRHEPGRHVDTTDERGGVRGQETPVPESEDAHFADARDVDRLLGERHDDDEGPRAP